MAKNRKIKAEEILKANLNKDIAFKNLTAIVIRMSVPAILAQISSIVMQYIDSAMVGSLGAAASASIGLVSTSTWLIGGLCGALSAGFSVQTAQLIGASRYKEAKEVFKQSLICALVFGLMLAAAGTLISGSLPAWLGGDVSIRADSSRYFMIYAFALPFVQLRQLSGTMLQSSGNMKIPSILNASMCGLDVIFNFLLIFPARDISIAGCVIHIFGAGMGVSGAALGTALSELVISAVMMYMVCFRSEPLRISRGGWRIRKSCLKTAAKIALPIALEHTAMCGAQVASTKIIVPLGIVPVAANSLAVTAESFCYMPGYGIGSAAATLVGQSIGAGNKKLAKRCAWISVALGAVFMAVMGAIMFVIAPLMFKVLTPAEEIRELGARVLRIEAFAEPFYAVSIVASGVLRGAGDTFIPGLMNLFSMWFVRIVAAAILAPIFGLPGVWIAMCGELCIRGIMFFVRLLRGKWLKTQVIA